MSTNKQPRLRKAGERVFPASRKSPLELLRLPAECSTTDLISALSHKVRVAARKVRRQPHDDEPEAASGAQSITLPLHKPKRQV